MTVPNPLSNPNLRRPLRVGIIGMGGFAGTHHDTIHVLEQAGECKLICTCDPDPGAFIDKMGDWDFGRREGRYGQALSRERIAALQFARRGLHNA